MEEAVTQVADNDLAVATTRNVLYQAELFHKTMKLLDLLEEVFI